MAEILPLPYRMDREGAERLLAGLGEDFVSGEDLGPRGPQIRAIGLALERLSLELRRMIEDRPVGISAEASRHTRPDPASWRDDILGLADAFARLGASVRHFPL